MPHRLLSRLLGPAVLLAAPSLVVPHGLTLAPTTAIAQGTPANDAPLVPPATRCPAPAGYSETGITVGLEATFAPAEMVSYGLPVPASTVSDASALKVSARGEPVPATVAVLLDEHDADGAPVGVRSVLVQVPAAVVGYSAWYRWTGKGTSDRLGRNQSTEKRVT